MRSRYPGTEGHAQARRYIEQVLAASGAPLLGVAPGGPRPQNVFAVFGPNPDVNIAPDLVVGAHYDSIADRTPGWKPLEGAAPGANDNGTGVGGLLEIARLLADEHRAGYLRRNVAIVFFDEEETGMRGSQAWVAGAFRSTPKIMLNLDMVGFSAPRKRKLDVVRYANSGDLLDRAWVASERFGLGLQLVDRLLPADLKTWVDSTPFAMAGVPAITITESYGQPGIDYPGYPGFHRVTDTPDQINNAAQWRAATQLVLAMTLELAR